MLRPEDLRIYDPTDQTHGGLLGRIIESNYKGSTLDSIIELTNGHVIKASEFFDEDDPSFDYKLNELKEFFKSRQEIVIPMDITLHNEADKMAGTVDLLTVDSNGNFRVYDIKTMRNDHFTPDEYGTTKYDSTLVFETYGKY